MPRTLEEIHRGSFESPTLRGLVGVLNEKLQLRARYALLEYEAGMEGRPDCAALYREMSELESDQIARLSAVLAIDLQSEDSRPHTNFPLDPDGRHGVTGSKLSTSTHTDGWQRAAGNTNEKE